MSAQDQSKWNERHAHGDPGEPPGPFWRRVSPWIPQQGTALDVAGGLGRHAFAMARHGLRVTLLDVSDVAVAAVNARATELALNVVARQWDLETNGVPAELHDVVWCTFFWEAAVWAALEHVVKPGGVLCLAHPTQLNLQRHARPSARWLLAPGAIHAVVPGWERLWEFEDWTPQGTHEAQLVARRPR